MSAGLTLSWAGGGSLALSSLTRGEQVEDVKGSAAFSSGCGNYPAGPDFSSIFGPMTLTGFGMVLFSRVDQLAPRAVAGDLAPL